MDFRFEDVGGYGRGVCCGFYGAEGGGRRMEEGSGLDEEIGDWVGLMEIAGKLARSLLNVYDES